MTPFEAHSMLEELGLLQPDVPRIAPPEHTYVAARGLNAWHLVPTPYDGPVGRPLCGQVVASGWAAFAYALTPGDTACDECERRKGQI